MARKSIQGKRANGLNAEESLWQQRIVHAPFGGSASGAVKPRPLSSPAKMDMVQIVATGATR